ncbi:hypothetical protein UPYG_G00202730 [Umbra pygmaea]|uniref:RING-type domain-containing protein n=1 Tax=Umbra pygmaea TaxID=75934 RepID=A0ABD0X6G4_UMBPY
MPGRQTDSEASFWQKIFPAKTQPNPKAKHAGKKIGCQNAQPQAESNLLDYKLSKSISLHLSCPACSTFMLHPVSLPCGHFLCLPCLESLREKASSADASDIQQPSSHCPRCEAPFPIHPGGTWPFTVNILLANVAEHILHNLEPPKTTLDTDTCLCFMPCSFCHKQREVLCHCITCNMNHCTNCLKKLRGKPEFQAHKLSESVLTRRMMCPIHHKEYMFQKLDVPTMSSIQEDRNKSEVEIRNVLQEARKMKAKCEADRASIKELIAQTVSEDHELRRLVHEGFLSLHNVLLDQEVAVLSYQESLTNSFLSGVRDFLQKSTPLLDSFTGLEWITEQALVEPDALTFLTGAGALNEWLLKAKIDFCHHVLPLQEGESFKVVKVDFNSLLRDLQYLLDIHLRLMRTELAAGVTELTGETAGISEACFKVVQVFKCPESPDKEFRWQMPWPPAIKQHVVRGTVVEISCTLPVGDEVDTFDVHFQNAETTGMTMAEGKGVLLAGLKAGNMQSTRIWLDTRYIFRVRSVNSHGSGKWSSTYRVNTKHLGDTAKLCTTQEI